MRNPPDSLREYIEEALKAGASKQQIRDTLTGSGWTIEAVEQSLNEFIGLDELGVLIPAPSDPPFEIFRDLFLYLLSLITLLLSVTGLIGIAFQLTDKFLSTIDSDFSPEQLSAYLAMLLISLPVYLLSFQKISAVVEAQPRKARSYIRKGFLYVILLLASLTLLGDLIQVLYTFLNGDLSSRFILRTIALSGTCGGVMFWYAYELKKDNRLLLSNAVK